MGQINDTNKCIPQNDLDCYYNKKWKISQKLSSKQKMINNFTIINDRIGHDNYEFIQHAVFKNDPNSMHDTMICLRDSYQNRHILSPIIRLIETIHSTHDISEILFMMASLNIPSIFTFSTTVHFKDPKIYTLYIDETLDIFEEEIPSDKFLKKLSKLLKLIQSKYAIWKNTAFISHIIVFASLLSKFRLSNTEKQDQQLVSNSMTHMEFIATYDVNNIIHNVLKKLIPNDTYYISYPNTRYMTFIKQYLMALDATRLMMLKDYLIFMVFMQYGIYSDLGDNIRDLYTDNYSEKRVFLDMMYGTCGEYIESCFNKSLDMKKVSLVHDIFNKMKSYSRKYFEYSAMFEEPTKQEAIKKIDSMLLITSNLITIRKRPPMPSLSTSFYDNLFLLHTYWFRESIKLIGQPVDRNMIPINNDIFSFDVNAYYDSSTNSIYIPTGILDDIFIRNDVPPIYNYGGLGTIIGHEMMHCFDTQGSQYDHLGRLHNWWTDLDRKKYDLDIKKVIDHYEKLQIHGLHVNGIVTVSENIADIAGMKLSLRTYQMYYGKENLDLFFYRWSAIWKSVSSKKFIKFLINVDEHSPDSIRINAPLSHISEYYDAFKVMPHNTNYLDSTKRMQFLDEKK